MSASLANRIWSRDPAVFGGTESSPAVLESVRSRLGWLDAPAAISGDAGLVRQFTADVRAAGLTHIVLLGMGGSSLGAEVLRDTAGRQAHASRLTVLDTTDERAVRHVTESIDPERTLFLVASKSGTTVEVKSLERHFWTLMCDARGAAAGQHFAAITDPDTKLEQIAAEGKYRHTFLNPPDIGGRYSVLSLFGLVPASLVGHDIGAMATGAVRMAEACRADDASNPGVALGTFMAREAQAGRDKLTVLLSPALASFGAWIEQLVAESTGKRGEGIVPIVGEPIGPVKEYGPDRAFVAVLSETSGAVAGAARDLEKAGRPVFRIATSGGSADLAAEFFRWEFATAVAGALLGVNPFDEPNVKDAKSRTLAQLESRSATGAFRIDPPFVRGEGYSRREFRPEQAPTSTRRRYLALLDFLPADPARTELFDTFRAVMRRRVGLATTHGLGPRYLHSTGQLHKGGPNTGIFVLLTATDASATPVPGTDYTFSTLKQAQALGDFDALVAGGREVVHYHLEDPTADFAVTLERLIGRIID